MTRLIFCSALLALILTGCGSDLPTAPRAIEPDKSAVLEAEALSCPAPSATDNRRDKLPRGGSMTRRTWHAAFKFDRAVRQYARDNEGIYPGGLNGANLAGKTLLDYLPGDRLLRNAFTGLRTEPSGLNADYPGAIGYNTYVSGAVNVGYVITAMGVDPSEMLILLSDPE